ncbi:YbhB/YbcL family Raf kinase inhibitor-like protein [Candidatus Microgenomates bacterium]|nr:YbhB/YbcL family Raf kinase inhibitor-like protein [Candidatus Microgenomates bacterium]
MILNSSSFASGQEIPSKYTCEGDNANPNLTWENVPTEAKSLLLVMDDPDAEGGIFTHWLVWNIDPKITEIKENFSPGSAVIGKNDFGSAKYEGPCPPFGKHRYFFKIYALDKLLDLADGSTISEVKNVVQKHLLDSGELEGYYVKKLK